MKAVVMNEIISEGVAGFDKYQSLNLKYAEIAEILNISVGTVETHMVCALKFLRKRLSHPLSAAFMLLWQREAPRTESCLQKYP